MNLVETVVNVIFGELMNNCMDIILSYKSLNLYERSKVIINKFYLPIKCNFNHKHVDHG